MNCGTIGTISSSYTQAVWSGSNRITINRPASDLTDFTFLFSGTYDFLKTTANGGLVTSASGFDIVFYSNGPLSSIMKFERAYWNGTTGECEFWVKIPTLSSSFNTVIYLAYGNSAIVTDQSDAPNAWDTNTKAVYHYADGTTLSVTDSIGVNNGTVVGSVTATSGKIDGGAEFAGTDDYINNGTDVSLESTTFTYSAWINPTGDTIRTIFGNSQDSNGPSIYLNNGGGNELFFVQQNNSNIANTGSGVITNGQWNFIAVSYDGTNYGIFYNGSLASGTNAKTLDFGGDRLIGAFINAGSAIGEYTGVIDEVKYANVIRNEAWLDAEYANQNSPSTFYTIT